MREQILLPGFESELTTRIFFAVFPDTSVVGSIDECRRAMSKEYGLRGRPIIPGRLHVSLLGLGDYPGIPQRLITKASEAAASVERDVFTATFDRVLSFAGGRHGKPLVLAGGGGIEGLTLLQQGLVAELRRAGLRIKTRDHFTPHLTLLYASGTVAPRAVQPVSWVVREFVLVHSQIGRNLPYQVLGRWPLTHQSCIGER